MQIPVWFSYDLGIKGDYEGLYEWLDGLEAKECGDGVAFFLWNDTEDGDIPAQIRRSLLNQVEYDAKKDRVYVIYKRKAGEETLIKGTFVLGTRKANPWQGFSVKEEAVYEEY